MRRLPRRLGHDQHADLVEHLDELRTRLVISLVAVAAGFGVAYAFHARVIEFLNQALPERIGTRSPSASRSPSSPR